MRKFETKCCIAPRDVKLAGSLILAGGCVINFFWKRNLSTNIARLNEYDAVIRAFVVLFVDGDSHFLKNNYTPGWDAVAIRKGNLYNMTTSV
jgi:hypothetical protein